MFSVQNNIEESTHLATVSNGTISINGEGSAQVIDLMGHIVMTLGDAKRGITTSSMAPGIYTIRLINGENVKTQKIIIK